MAGGLFADATELSVRDMTIDGAVISGLSAVYTGILMNSISGSGTFTAVTIRNSSISTDGVAGGFIGLATRRNMTDIDETTDVTFDDCHLIGTAVSGAAGAGYIVGHSSGYDPGEKLTFRESCSVEDPKNIINDSPYREGNEGTWLAGNDYTKYDSWLGNEVFYRGRIYFGAHRFIPCWDGSTAVKPLEDEDKVKLIYSIFDLAYLQNTDAGTIRLMENVDFEHDLNGAAKSETRSHLFTPLKTLAKIEGNGHTIYNMTIKGSHYAGFVSGSNCSTTFQDVDFDGADIRVTHDPEGGNAYAGTLRGFSYGRTNIMNVHVRNGYLYGVNKMGGLCGGIFSTLNCHDSSVENYSIENYNSGIKDNGFYANGEIGGLFGYISNTDFTETSTVSNCTAKDNSFNCVTYDAAMWDRSVAPFIGDVRTMKGETLIIEGCSVLGNNTYTNSETGEPASFDNSWQCQNGVKEGFLGIETATYATYTSEFVGQCYSVHVNLVVVNINDTKGTVIIDGEKVYYDYTKL